MDKTTMPKFDPEEHQKGTYEAFCEYVEEFQYEYDAIAKEPPKELTTAAGQSAWVEQNKRKIFLGKFASRNLQKHFEEAVTSEQRSTITFSDTIKALKTYYDGGRNKSLCNYEFNKLAQEEEESFDAFHIRVSRKADQCDFKCSHDDCTVPDTLIRDRIVFGTRNDEIRKNALKNQWKLEDLVKQGRALESAVQGAQQIKEEISEDNTTRRVKKPGKYSRKNKKRTEPTQATKQKETAKKRCNTCSSPTCKGGKKCIGSTKQCFDCLEMGHFRGAACCKGKKSNRLHPEETSSESDDYSSDSSEEDTKKGKKARRITKCVTYVNRMQSKKTRKTSKTPRYEVDVAINGQIIKAFADTGADISVMSKKQAKILGLKLNKTKMKIKPYGSRPVQCKGSYIGTIMHGENVVNACIYVVKQEVETLLSGRVCEELGIIKFDPQPTVYRTEATGDKDAHKARLTRTFPKVFEDRVGRMKGYQVKLYIDDNVAPIAERRRPTPFHLREKQIRELNKMEAEGLIEEHHGPAPWISNTVLTPKPDGGTRVTVDMRNVNKAIQSTNIPIPRVEEIKSELAGCKVFSKLDFKSAFHQLEIEEASRYLTVFHGNDRLMRYRVLTMGCTPASGELTKALQPLFEDMKEVHVIHDDIIIATSNEARHKEVLNQALQIIEDAGMTLNANKCIFHKQEVPFWGVLVNENGIRPDPEKVNALKHATPPQDKQELISFLCMVQSNKEFMPYLAKNTYHLRQFTKKNKKFKWTQECQREFNKLKKDFTEKMLMTHFDRKKKTYIHVDAHQSGLSAILLQGKSIETAKPVACASRTTTAVEQRYPQLDLEALAVDFGLRRFRYYCVGGPTVTVVTDHKPLVGVFQNTRNGSIRSERIKLRHQDMKYEVCWKKGSQNPADYLSRHGTPFSKLPKKIQTEAGEFEKTIWFLQFSPFTEAVSMQKIIKRTNDDPVLNTLKKSILNGYIPKSKKELKPFQKIFQELTISDEGLILKGEKIVLPEKLHDTALKKAHQGSHPGMSGLKRRLRSHFWFPKMDNKIEAKVEACKECTMFTNKTTKEPSYPHKISDEAWKDLSIDLFGPMPDKQHVIAVIDKSSRFPAAKIVPNTSNKAVTNALTEIYSDFGYPNSHQSDNGPPFNSEAFAKFSSENGIEHIKTYPYHPSGNPVENFMRTIGKNMKIAHQQRGNKKHALNQMLSSYRATPHPSTGIAPGNVMFRSGYQKDFPRTSVEDTVLKEALAADRSNRERKSDEQNASNHRMHSDIQPNQLVYTRNNNKNKFDPIFGPELHKVVDVKGNGTILLRLSDDRIVRRHLDDVKDATPVERMVYETCWMNSNPQTPAPEPQPVQNPTTLSDHNPRPTPQHPLPPNTLTQRNQPTTPIMNSGWCNIDESNILPTGRRGTITPPAGDDEIAQEHSQ